MTEPLSFAFLTDCKALHSPFAHPDLSKRLFVISSLTNHVRPEPLAYYGNMLSLTRFDDPERIGFSLPQLGDREQHYLINSRFSNPLIASVMKLINCSFCPERIHCLPKVRKAETTSKLAGIVLANHHFS